MGYRRIVLSLVYLGIVPAVLLSLIGVLLLFVGEAGINLLVGILVLTFTGTLVTGVILVWVFVRRERNLSELQADFVSKVSHELRTPLTSIRLFTETLKLRRGDVATEDRCIAALDQESARLEALISRLLDWGRMESGMRTFDFAPHACSDIVQEALATFEPTRSSRDVELSYSPPTDSPIVTCDRPAIVDSLVNLLSNAYKYGGQPKRIHVSVEHDSKEVKILVKDNGIGIPRREHHRIFLRFYRVDDKLTRNQEGSGLGLAIVQYVMKAHSGRVQVESALGEGSTFALVLPIRRPVTDALLPDMRDPARKETRES